MTNRTAVGTEIENLSSELTAEEQEHGYRLWNAERFVLLTYECGDEFRVVCALHKHETELPLRGVHAAIVLDRMD